jgi:uncharacterized integral membrane protein
VNKHIKFIVPNNEYIIVNFQACAVFFSLIVPRLGFKIIGYLLWRVVSLLGLRP